MVVSETVSGEEKSYIDPALLLTQGPVENKQYASVKFEPPARSSNITISKVPEKQVLPPKKIIQQSQPNGLAAALALNINPFAIKDSNEIAVPTMSQQSKGISLPQSTSRISNFGGDLRAERNDSKLKCLILTSCCATAQKSSEEKHPIMQELKQIFKCLHPAQRLSVQSLLSSIKIHKFASLNNIQDFVRDLMLALTTVNGEVALMLLKYDEIYNVYNLLSCLIPVSMMEIYVNSVNQTLRVINAKHSIVVVSNLNNNTHSKSQLVNGGGNSSSLVNGSKNEETCANSWQPSKRAKLIATNANNNDLASHMVAPAKEIFEVSKILSQTTCSVSSSQLDKCDIQSIISDLDFSLGKPNNHLSGQDGKFECAICMETAKLPCVNRVCGHICCEACWFKWFNSKSTGGLTCPICRKVTCKEDLKRLIVK